MSETESDSPAPSSSTNEPVQETSKDRTHRESKVSKSHWSETLISGLTVIGVAVAAAYASTNSQEKAIGITAWIAVAIVGASTMISTMKNVNR